MIAAEQFRDAIAAAGLRPPDEIIADGKLHRFATNGRADDDAGWYVFHDDGVPAGSFGDWRTDLSETWQADPGRRLTSAEKAAHRARLGEFRRAREAEGARRHADAREQAARIWNAATPATDVHAYLARKQVRAYGLRIHADGRLIVPVQDDGELHSLQFIDGDGDKLFLAGGRVKGCYHIIGTLKGATALSIAEGYATGATIHAATGYPVAIAFNAGNLAAVAKAMRARCPELRLILCADDDIGTQDNPGRTKATEAARAVGGWLAVPDFGADRPTNATDFNDLMNHRGIEAVAHAIDAGQEVQHVDQTRHPILSRGDTANTSQPAAQLQVYTLGQLRKRPLPECIVDRLIAERSINALIGKSGNGKSFVAADLGLSLSTGVPWHGRTVKPGAAVYVTSEGSSHFIKRIDAWKQQHGITEDPPFFVIDTAVNLMRREGVDLLCGAMAGLPPAALVILDPLAAFMVGGKQNDADDIAIINAVSFSPLRERTGAALLVVMHAGWNEERERGSSHLRDICDTSIFVKASDRAAKTAIRTLTLSELKQKDLEAFDPISLELRPVLLGMNGKEVTTCIVTDPTPGAAATAKRIGPAVQQAFTAIRAAGAGGLSYTAWQKAAGVSDGTIRNAIETFTKSGLVILENGLYRATEPQTAIDPQNDRNCRSAHNRNSQPQSLPPIGADCGDCGAPAGGTEAGGEPQSVAADLERFE